MKRSIQKPIVQITGSSVGARGVYSFKINIAAPKKDTQSGDYFCKITSSHEIEFRLDVFGTIPQQAVRLALEVASARVASILSADICDTPPK
jgi:hypothetical protein